MNVPKYLMLTYANKGRDIAGVDCWGLIRLIFKEERNITLARCDGYLDSEDKEQTEKVILSESLAHWEQVNKPAKYDAVVFDLAGKPSHIGMMISDSEFIHALKGRGVTIERISNVLWRRRVQAYYRYSA